MILRVLDTLTRECPADQSCDELIRSVILIRHGRNWRRIRRGLWREIDLSSMIKCWAFLSHWVRIGSCILSNENWLYKQCGNSQSTHAVPHNQSLKVSSIYMSLHMCHDFTLLKIWSLLLRTTRVNSWFHPWIWPHIRRPYTLEEQFWLGKMAWQLVSDFQTVEVKQITGP